VIGGLATQCHCLTEEMLETLIYSVQSVVLVFSVISVMLEVVMRLHFYLSVRSSWCCIAVCGLVQ